LARFLEDLIDNDPKRRLLLPPEAPKRPDEPKRKPTDPRASTFPRLHDELHQQLEAVKASQEQRADPNADQGTLGLFDVLRPSSRSPGRLWRLVVHRWKQGSPESGEPGANLRHLRENALPLWLLFWTFVSALGFWLCFLAVVTWTRWDLGFPPDNFALRALRILFHTTDPIPILDGWRQKGYQVGTEQAFRANLASRVVALSFAFASVKYYQTLFATLSPLRAGRTAKTVATEAIMRLYAFWGPVLIIIPILFHPRYWTFDTALGLTTTFIGNLAVFSYANSGILRAREMDLTTVPRQRIPGLEMFRLWAPSMFVYMLIVWPCAILIDRGILQDVPVYASLVALVNVGLFYFVKCGIHGATVRGGLVRAFLAAERFELVAKAEGNGSAASPASSGQAQPVTSGTPREG
jgi:hypothetical protein